MNNSSHLFLVLAHGKSPYLEECLSSLLSQTLRSRQVIVTSTPNDHISDVASRLGIPVVINAKNEYTEHAMADDWNFALTVNDALVAQSGLEAQSGPEKIRLRTLVHQDDIYLPTFLEETLELFNRFPETLIAFTNYEEIREGGQARKRNPTLVIKDILLSLAFGGQKAIGGKQAKRWLLSLGSAICCPSVTYNTEKISLEKEGMPFERSMRTNLDWDFWLRLSQIDGLFAFCPSVLLRHRIHGGSETSRGLVDKARQEEDRKMFERIWPQRIAVILNYLYSLSYRSNKVSK